MRKSIRRRKKFDLKQLLISLAIIFTFAAACAGFLYWYTTKTDAEIAHIQQTSNDDKAANDKKVAEIKARKAAEAKARARATAKKLLTTSASSLGSIDSKTCNSATTHIDPSSIDVLANKKHCLQPLDYAPSDLVYIGGFQLSAKAATKFKAMQKAAAAAGQSFSITSSYRSYSTQITTYNYWVGISGKAGADTYSARPGYSEHQTGFAVDIEAGSCALDCFGGTSQYKWLQKNAAKYGFIQRYYKGYEKITGYSAEEWHYRYVGVATAQDMKAKGIKTLEQYWGLPGGGY